MWCRKYRDKRYKDVEPFGDEPDPLSYKVTNLTPHTPYQTLSYKVTPNSKLQTPYSIP